MKKTIFLIALALSIAFWSCGETEPTTQKTTTQTETTPETDAAEVASNLENTAVCLWSKVGLRSAPGRGKDAEYMTTMYFGEKVSLTGKERDADDKTYWEMELSDGSKGWAHEYLFAKGVELAVATDALPLYKRPDLATMQGKNFEKGDLIVVKPAKNGWQEAIGFEKKREGWIQENTQTSTSQSDILVAMLYKRAMNADKADERKKQLETIMGNSALTSSNFIYLVQEALAGAEPEEEEIPEVTVADNELFIIANKLNVRSGPTIDEDNVVFQLEKGQVATIIQKASERENVNDMEDYWYKIDFEGQSGWVFGYHTSKRIGL